jgi:glutamate dehydrogenase (NAD(P)+)
MAWIMDTYSMHVRSTTTAVVTGKPLAIGGSRGRHEATGRGVMIACREAMPKLGLRPENARVVIQGSGNVGGVAAQLMHREGFRIVSLSDMYGMLHAEKGLDVPAVMRHLKEKRRLEGFGGADYLPNSSQLELDCDILIPAAVENAITSKNAERVKARLIVEGANGPTTVLADKVLESRGVIVVPDILANAGGVTVSYFEWVQDRAGFFWTEDVVNSRLEQIMTTAFRSVDQVAEQYGVSLRIAAYILAVDRVAKVYQLRGLYA